MVISYEPLVVGRVVGGLVDDDAERVVVQLAALDPAAHLMTEMVKRIEQGVTAFVLGFMLIGVLLATIGAARLLASFGACAGKRTLAEVKRQLRSFPS